MVKQIIAIIVLSILVVIGASHFHQALSYLLDFHAYVLNLLGHVFSGGILGIVIKRTLTLLAIPVVIGLILGGLYWAIRRSQSPYIMHITWIVWIILATALVMKA